MIVLQALDDPEVIRLLNQGAVGIIPTDTVYGVVARADDAQAVGRLYELKARDRKPGTIIAANVEQLTRLGVHGEGLQAVKHYWPGPISIVIDASDQAGYLHQGVGSLAVRIPDDRTLQRLLQQTGPLATTSANHPGEPTVTDVAAAQRSFGDQVDFYVDGGDRSGRVPSTVARYQNGKLTVLRRGAVIIEQ